MARWFALVLLVLVSVTPAQAITITSGTVGAWQGGDFGGAYDLHGDGFDLVAFHHGSNEPVSFAQYTRGGSYDVPRDFSHTVALGPQIPGSPVPLGFIEGSITWNIEPVVVPRPTTIAPPPFDVVPVTAPFTMTGVLNGTEVDGAGTFTLGALAHDSGWHVWSLNFDFAPFPSPPR
jgi:hypothetical protein